MKRKTVQTIIACIIAAIVLAWLATDKPKPNEQRPPSYYRDW